MSGIWNEVAILEDPPLRTLVPDISGLVYRNQVKVGLVEMARLGVFEDWRLGYSGEAFAYCFFFITELSNNCPTNDMGVSFVQAVVYGIKHSMAGLVSCPVSHPLVKSALEGAKRKLARPVCPKEPLSVDTVQAIANFYSSDVSLAVLLFFLYC